ncbi:MAG TPA: metal-dependent hydrolase [Candidatus Moranbacteria bacterium]|nr:metal-dependent hydrolase [Candidatus Moranbacteria bacterium]
MAKFKTHMGWGVFVGVALVVAGLIYSIISGIESAIWIFSAVLLGSFLPDLDLDGGVPFQILFGLLGAGFAGFIFFNFYQEGERSLKILILIPALTFVAVRFIAGYIFEKFTHHRGMFHSIPAAILFGLLTIWFSHLFKIIEGKELVIGASVAIGYIGHLILDEIYSSTNLKGYSLLPKQSLGSALKFYSDSRLSTLLFYCLIFALALTLPETREFF